MYVDYQNPYGLYLSHVVTVITISVTGHNVSIYDIVKYMMLVILGL